MRLLAALVLGLLAIAPAALPAGPSEPAAEAVAPFGERPRLPALGPAEALNRFVPRAPGTVVDATYVFGPFAIPPGWDFNRLWLDVPVHDGFVTKLAYRLVDAATGEAYTNMQVHIHHALWFENVADGGLIDFGELIYGTGEELTRVDLDARSDAVPGGPRYGLWMPQAGAQSILLMLHNKEQAHRVVQILLDVTFVHGSAAAIRAARACDDAAPLPRAGCAAGAEFRALDGRLWGATFHVPRQAGGPGIHVHPSLTGPGIRFTADADGTLVHAAGHVHVNGLRTVIVNLGSADEPCSDLDRDGFPGITLLRSDKLDRVAAAWPHSEDFQMGVTHPGWRAPVRAGDRIAQWGVYANRDYASYQAMAFAAVHADPAALPGPRGGACTLANTGPWLVGGGADPAAPVPNRAWTGAALPLCGVPGAPACDQPAAVPAGALAADTVAIAGFAYVPGDQHLAGPLGAPPRVRQGASLTFHNADASQVIRHTVTSCAWPCNGHHAANYPHPDGRFDSDRLGNLDILDGGSVPPNAGDDPVWATPADLPVGLYSYYCRLHPFMRGWFEVVP